MNCSVIIHGVIRAIKQTKVVEEEKCNEKQQLESGMMEEKLNSFIFPDEMTTRKNTKTDFIEFYSLCELPEDSVNQSCNA
jgi:uncharacterized protein YqkB